ncbi:hypothetical protein B7699_03170 [Streptococcus mitis]|uniref:Transposase IS30-like HTH domain-containing protein n=2 Tax=Streptococcus mitis TaxID=28037 RepID=A0A1X1K4C1_STRMT|nr:hypothetical protein B7699_03170 [Streptococcus mitis]
MRSTMTKHKHLTLSDRNDIQLGLERGETFKAIGQLILIILLTKAMKSSMIKTSGTYPDTDFHWFLGFLSD